MFRYALGWVLAASLVLPMLSPSPAAAAPVGAARSETPTESGPSGFSVLWGLVTFFIGPAGSAIDPSGKPGETATRQLPGMESKANAAASIACDGSGGSGGVVVVGNRL